MVCTKCGTNLPTRAKFCGTCGVALAVMPQQMQRVNMQPIFRQPVYQQAGYQQPVYPLSGNPADKYHGFSMKWYKFLVWFALWAWVVVRLLFVAVFNFLIGYINGEFQEDLYMYFDDLKMLDTVTGILMICVSGLFAYTTIRLLRLKTEAPKLLTIACIIAAVIPVLYLFIRNSILDDSDFKFLLELAGKQRAFHELSNSILYNEILSAITYAGFAGLNYSYFKKRESVFVN